MKSNYLSQLSTAIFFALLLTLSHSFAQQASVSNQASISPIGAEKSISNIVLGELRSFNLDKQIEDKSIDRSDVDFRFEFTQSAASKGTVRVILTPNVIINAPEFIVAVDGDVEIALSDKFSSYDRKKAAYKSVAPKAGYRTQQFKVVSNQALVLDIPITMTGDRAVINIGLQGQDGEGESASLFILRDNQQLYVGVQSFLFLQEQALREQLKKDGVDEQKIKKRIKQLRSKPTDIKVKIVPPPVGHKDSDPYNSIIVNGQIQFTDINGATFPVQNADVEIYDVNGGSETLMDSGSTDSSGNYSVTVVGVDTSGDATGPDILVRAYPRGPLVRVHVADGGDVYTMDSSVQTDVVDDSTVTIDMTAGNDESINPGQVAFEVYEANRYFAAFITSVNGSAPSQLLVEYPRSAAGDGSSYTPGSTRMNLAISDGHDWDNIQHEYGHHVQNIYNLANSPGGAHSSSQNSCSVRPSKDEALRLAWGESWPTVYSIIAQNQQNLATLNIPNVGDTSYTDTKPAGAALNYDLESSTTAQTGEATERAIMRLMWDSYDSTDDNVDVGVSFSAQNLWDAVIASNPETFSTYWAQFVSLLSEAEKIASGGTLTREGFGANLTAPANGTTYSGGAAPTFTWTANLPCDSGGNGRYSIHFQHQGTGALLYASPFQSSTSFTPTTDQLEQIFVAAGGNVNWTVLTRDLTAPQTGDYYSETRAIVDDFDVPDRDPVDITLVLDMSSSMNSPPPGGDLAKIDVLQQAVELFINTWNVHSIDGDRLGLIYFNDNTSSIAGTPPAPVLNDVAASALSYISDVNSKTGSGCTAVGGALQEAFNNFDVPERDKFVLLFSDGIQNVNPFVGTNASDELLIKLYASDETNLPFGGFFCNTNTADGLDGSDITPDGETLAAKDITIHSIGVGVDGTDFEDLIEQVSAETSGEHHFTSLPDAELDIFFTNDLVESLKQNTLQIVKAESGDLNIGAQHRITVPVGASASSLTFAISWKNNSVSNPVSVQVTPPGTSIPVTKNTLGKGHRVIHYEMPINAEGMNADGAGDWLVTLSPSAQTSIPFQFSAIVDEGCFKFDMIRPSGKFKAGDLIPIRVKLGVGTSPLKAAENIHVKISQPELSKAQLLADWLSIHGGHFLGKTLSNSSLKTLRKNMSLKEEHQFVEKSPYMINRLESLAFQEEEFLEKIRMRNVITLPLFDDGLQEHGDEVAGDGIYSNLTPKVMTPGNYQSTFEYSGSNACGPATRKEVSSFLVRLGTIDAVASDLRVFQTLEGKTEIRITPQDGFGNLLGPGYGDQINISYGQGKPSGATIDNFNGTYSQVFAGETGSANIEITIRGEVVKYPSNQDDQQSTLCWILILGCIFAVIGAIIALIMLIRSKRGALNFLIVSLIIAILLGAYILLHC